MAGGQIPNIAELRRHASRFMRFGMVGVGNVTVDFLVYTAAVFLGVMPALANVLSFSVANPMSYFVNSRVTFRSQSKPASISLRGYGKFLVAHLASLILGTAFIWYFADALGPLLAKLVAIGMGAVLNYTASAFLVFPDKQPGDSRPPEST